MKHHCVFTVSTSNFVKFVAGCALTLALPKSGLSQEVFRLNWKESGIRETVSGFRPHPLGLSTNRPEGLKKAPANLQDPSYGSFEIGPAKSPATILAIFDETKEGVGRLFLDSNANGDLTDDPACTLERKTRETPSGKEVSVWEGQGSVMIPFASGPRTGRINFYTTDTKPSNSAYRKMLLYYADYGLVGEVRVGGKTIGAALADAACSGEFKLSSDVMQTPILWLDLPSGTRAKGHNLPASRAFEVDGKWWAMTNLTPDGTFQIAASSESPEPKKVEGPDLSPGKKAPAFFSKLVDGKQVNFPADYKGKVVLVDFWATWCGPCIAELPNLTKAYKAHHPQGLEVLGISLDREDWEEKLVAFTKKRDMPWPQVYDGKYWGAAVARQYGVTSIPFMLLVDGDTGEILASGKALRGESLSPAVEKALARKKN